MATKTFVFLLAIVFLASRWQKTESKSFNETAPQTRSGSLEKRVVVDPLSVIGLVVSVASAIQGVVCTFTDVCGGDEVSEKLDALERKLDAIADDVKSIKKDVEEIWNESKRKWYFKHIEYTMNERKKVIRELKENDKSEVAKERRKRFINEVLGGGGKDEYVEKALFHLTGLITKEGLVEHYFKAKVDSGLSTYRAAKLTWLFIRKFFRYQEDGYASVIFAASMKYQNDKPSYEKIMSQVCTWWTKIGDPKYKTYCENFLKDPYSEDRRKTEEDHIFAMRDLFVYPVQEVKSECTGFGDSDGLHYAVGYLFVSQPAQSKILVVNRDDLKTVKTIEVPGAECGGRCHPLDISINADKKVMAVAAHSKAEGGDSYVLMFKIKGDLTEPSGFSIEHYYTLPQLFQLNGNKPDVRGVAFCGDRFAYADYNGAIYNWKMRWGLSEPTPSLNDRYDWYLHRFHNKYYGKINYLGCSTSGSNWVVESSRISRSDPAVGAIPADTTAKTSDFILKEIAQMVVTRESWDEVKDERSRMDIVKGIAMDAEKNIFYSADQLRPNSVVGIYERTYDAKRRFIREWDYQKDSQVKIFDMTTDANGFLFVVQASTFGDRCLHKYHYQVDLEDIDIK